MNLDNYEYNEENAVLDATAALSGDQEDKYIDRSGMQLITIKSVKTEKFASGSEAIILGVTNELNEYGKINLFYKDKKGNKMFGRNMFDALIKIINLVGSKNIAEDIKGCQVLAAISAVQNGDFVNIEAKSFFFPETKLTTTEVFKEVTEPKQYAYWKKKIDAEIKEQLEWETTSTGELDDNEDDDEFPF